MFRHTKGEQREALSDILNTATSGETPMNDICRSKKKSKVETKEGFVGTLDEGTLSFRMQIYTQGRDLEL